MAKLTKIKMELNIIIIKFRQNEPLGYCFVLNEEEKILKDDNKREERINKMNRNKLVEYNKNLLLYDIQKFNYIRTVMKDIEEVADEEVSGSIDLENENNKSHKDLNSPSKKSKRETISSNDSKKTKKSQKKSKKNNKSKSYSSSSSSYSSSDENEKNKKNPLTKEAIMLLKNKDAEAARTFILNLPFYGSDVNLTRKSPNGSDFKVGFGFEPNIKISVASHIDILL